ncbi:hypothetical protein L1887_21269 [Cichorium endivia]|nr:hypothetical protein L1887_21269 [Cichorium endivia]
MDTHLHQIIGSNQSLSEEHSQFRIIWTVPEPENLKLLTKDCNTESNDVRRGSKDIIGEVRSPQQPIGLRGRSERSTLLSSSSKVFLVVVLIGLLCKHNQKEEVERTSISGMLN